MVKHIKQVFEKRHGMQETHSTDQDACISRWRGVCSSIIRAAGEVSTRHKAVALVCVSKTQSKETILPLLNSGQRVFGENRVQEAQTKWPDLKQLYKDVELHLIGPLQSNKVSDAVALFDVIETLDRPKVAEALSAEFMKTKRRPTLYVQVNTGSEPQKAGILPEKLDAFIVDCKTRLGLPIEGLMCIPPVDQPASAHFGFLRLAAQRHDISNLSMGMSADYELAIQLGATHVRVGSAIFGSRY